MFYVFITLADANGLNMGNREVNSEESETETGVATDELFDDSEAENNEG